MFAPPEIMSMAGALSANASDRLSAIAGNVANADTPGYRAQDGAAFADVYGGGAGLALRQTRAGHLAAAGGEAGGFHERPAAHASPNGNSVSLEDEMMRAAAVRKDNDLALTVYKSALNILRASLGRR